MLMIIKTVMIMKMTRMMTKLTVMMTMTKTTLMMMMRKLTPTKRTTSYVLTSLTD